MARQSLDRRSLKLRRDVRCNVLDAARLAAAALGIARRCAGVAQIRGRQLLGE